MKTADTRSPSANLSRKDRAALFLEYEGNKRLRNFGTRLYRLTGGRFPFPSSPSITPRDRDVILLTTLGRKSGRQHTVLLQSFPQGSNMIIVAANSGRSSHPDWFHNLMANPTAQVEIMGRTLLVRAEELSDEEAAAFWPRILQCAPGNARYRKATSRAIPLVGLVPNAPGEGAPRAS